MIPTDGVICDAPECEPESSTLLTEPIAVSLVHLLSLSTVYHPEVCLNILSFPSHNTVYVCLAIHM